MQFAFDPGDFSPVGRWWREAPEEGSPSNRNRSGRKQDLTG
jgi:hypothetical protein